MGDKAHGTTRTAPSPTTPSRALPVHHRSGQASPAIARRRAAGVATSSKKPTIIAMEEVRRGLVKYSLTGQAPEEPQPEAVL